VPPLGICLCWPSATSGVNGPPTGPRNAARNVAEQLPGASWKDRWSPTGRRHSNNSRWSTQTASSRIYNTDVRQETKQATYTENLTRSGRRLRLSPVVRPRYSSPARCLSVGTSRTLDKSEYSLQDRHFRLSRRHQGQHSTKNPG